MNVAHRLANEDMSISLCKSAAQTQGFTITLITDLVRLKLGGAMLGIMWYHKNLWAEKNDNKVNVRELSIKHCACPLRQYKG